MMVVVEIVNMMGEFGVVVVGVIVDFVVLDGNLFDDIGVVVDEGVWVEYVL